MNRADRIADDGSRRRNNVGFALQILQRRLASSPAAIHESLKRRLTRLERRLEEEKLGQPGRDADQPITPAEPEDAIDEDDLEDATGEEMEAQEERLLDRATAAQTIAELKTEIAELRPPRGDGASATRLWRGHQVARARSHPRRPTGPRSRA